jgi:uncharacterized membrane protein
MSIMIVSNPRPAQAALSSALMRETRDAPPAAGIRRESHARSIAKAVSWRATGSLDTFILTLLITGSGAWAGSIAATEVITKILAYYFHERVWSWVRWGRR